MANRFEDEFPQAAQRFRPPPIHPDEIARYVERARRLRAEAMQQHARRLGAALARAARTVVAALRRRGGAKQAAAGRFWSPMDKSG